MKNDNKAAKYQARGVSVDWLLVQDSLIEILDYHWCGLLGHREIREKLERVFRDDLFNKVLLRTGWNHQLLSSCQVSSSRP